LPLLFVKYYLVDGRGVRVRVETLKERGNVEGLDVDGQYYNVCLRSRVWGFDWICLAQDIDMWRAVRNAVKNIIFFIVCLLTLNTSIRQ
jgi:hypothetical protein